MGIDIFVFPQKQILDPQVGYPLCLSTVMRIDASVFSTLTDTGSTTPVAASRQQTPETHTTRASPIITQESITISFPSTTQKLITTVTLLCQPTYMCAVIQEAYIRSKGYSALSLHLNDQNCKPILTAYTAVFCVRYGTCGTRKELHNGIIRYSNTVTASTFGSDFTKKKNNLLQLNCKVDQRTDVPITQPAPEIAQHEQFVVKFSFYASPSLLHPMNSPPFYVKPNQDLLVQATIYSSDPNLILFADTCVVYPNLRDFSTVEYDLISRGCTRDSTYSNSYSSDRRSMRFKFKPFRMPNRYSTLYLRCKMVVCKKYDYSSRCYQGCLPKNNRNKGYGVEKVIVSGPIKLRRRNPFH
ncbi:deleted in malignant brain tumors 1 protein [Alligator mississippiensis]|uniref:deleted in malignant brain tumors 1 protein n=1 Tax=Alligator mississippiensis TaxID=8496 RepID=UPI002877ECA8|nr:deleted in malignant brain tumors 1 protein [Alligator mississippiensis]